MRLHIYLLFVSFLLLFLSCNSPSEDKSEDSITQIVYSETRQPLPFQPNILWIVAEDLSFYMPSFGDSTIQTPNLSRLAAEGVRYTHMFSTTAVCSPSRSAIATGMFPTHLGSNYMRVSGSKTYLPEGIIPYEVVTPPEVKMHSEYLRRAGYYCTNNAKEDYQFQAPETAWDENVNQADWDGRATGQPFFSIFNLEVTHESRIWVKAEDSLWVDENLEVPIPPYLPNTDIAKQDIRRMYSNVKEMDDQVGEILAQLEAEGLMDSTIIFWYSDHGGPLPRSKRLLYDSGFKSPMIIRFPNQERAGEVDDQLLSFIDFLPTLMSIAGSQPPDYLHGRAFLGPYQVAQERDYIHGATDRMDAQYDMIRAVRDKRFKYLRNYKTDQGYYLEVKYREQMPIMQELLRLRDEGKLTPAQAQWFREEKPEEELFDCVADPHELNNLAEDPEYAAKLVELREEHERWLEEIDDKGFMSEREVLESFWPNLEQPETANPTAEMKEGKVHLMCETEGASIGYQLLANGEELKGQWKVYTEPFEPAEGLSLMYVAHRIGYTSSDTLSLDVN